MFWEETMFRKLFGRPEVPDGLGKPSMPTVAFDAKRVTAETRADLLEAIKRYPDIPADHLAEIHAAAVLATESGGDLHAFSSAIIALGLPDVGKRRAGQIATQVHGRASAMMTRDRQQSLGIATARWSHSGAPCSSLDAPAVQDYLHRGVDGKTHMVRDGLRVGGITTWPGREPGCKCTSRSIIPGLE